MAAHPERLLQHLLALVPREAIARATEAELLRRFVRGRDEDAFAALIARHGPMVFGVCRRLLRDAASAEDVAQATFLVLARKAGSVRRPGALAAWLHRTACHLALKQRRADTRRRGREARGTREASPRPPSDPVGELTSRELREAIDEEIRQLPERFRLPVILCCLEGRTLEEVAGRLEWTPGSVKGRLERGRAELRSRLVRRGFVLSAACAGLDVLREGAWAALPSGFGASTLRAAVEVGSRAGFAAMTRKVAVSLLLTVGILGGGVAAVSGPEQPVAPKPKARAAAPPVEKRKVDRQGDALPAGALARLGTVRWRNAAVIDAMAFSPDGRALAAASQVGVNLFDREGRITKRIRIPDTSFRTVAFSPDGTRLIGRCVMAEGGMYQTVVRICEVGAGQKSREVRAKDIIWAGWSAAGKPLALLQAKDEIILRDLESGRERHFEAKNLHDPIHGLFLCGYAPGANVLAFSDTGWTLHVFDTSSGKKLCTIDPKARYINTLALSPDGRSLAVQSADAANKGGVQIWDVATGKKTRAVEYSGAVAFAPDGKTLATVGLTDLRFWDASTGRERARTRGIHSFATRGVFTHGANFAFSPDSKTFATATGFNNGTIQLWDVGTGKQKAAPEGHAESPGQFDVSPDGKRVVSAGGLDGTVIVWDAATGEALTVIRRKEWARGAAFSADGKSLFSCWLDDRVIVYEASTGRELHTLRMDDPARKGIRQSGLMMRLSANRKTLLAFSLGYEGNEGPKKFELMTAWDMTTRKQTFQRSVDSQAFDNAVSSDFRLLGLTQGQADFPGRRPVRVEDCKTGELRLNLPQFAGQTFAKAISPDGRLLVASNLQIRMNELAATLSLWEMASGGEVLSLPGRSETVAFSPDGRVMARTVAFQEISLWDLRRDKELGRIKGFDTRVAGLAFSPDGKRLVSGHSDTTLLVWAVPAPAKARRLDAASAAQAWADLAGDPKKAFAARGALADSPAEAVALLKKRLGPVPPADVGELRRLLAGLDDDTFAVREKARKGLEALGDRATEALRQALGKKPSAEARKRIQALLRGAGGPVTDRETLRSLRAVGVLEDVGSRDARAVLETLAGGAAGARLTREAKATLERMGRP